MKKKLLVYSHCPEYGGSENIIENILCSQLINDKYDVTFHYGYNEKYERQLKIKLAKYSNLKIFGLPILSEISINNKRKERLQKDSLYYFYLFLFAGFYCIRLSGFFSLINFFIFRNLYKKYKPDILLINNGGYPAALTCRIAAVAGRNMNIENIIFVVNNMAVPPINFLDRLLDKYVEKAVKYFVTASVAAKQQLIKARNFPIEKCINIPNTLYNEDNIAHTQTGKLRNEFGITENIFIIGSAGLLTNRKGFHVLIDTINNLNKENKFHKIVCFIFGEGEERKNLEHQISTYNLKEKVFLPGFRPDIIQYMADFDVFILPSVNYEDFPYVNLEAMVLSKPIIGTKVAGIPEQVIEGINGFVVSPNNTEELQNAIENIYNNPNVQFGANSKKLYFDTFDFNKTILNYISCFES